MRLTTTNKDLSREMICRNEDCGVTEEHCPHLMEDECACLREVINKLAEYEDAEEQGLLLRLPVPIGTPVYRVVQDCGGDTLECRCGNCKDCEDLHRFVVEIKFGIYMLDSIGKSIFLTREEAEAALVEKGEQNEK